jgi:protein ECT2
MVSRSSVYTQSTTTGDSSLTRFSCSNSTLTAATTMSLMDNESFGTGKSLTRNKLVKRGKSKSPGGSENDSSPVRSRSRSRSQSRSREASEEREYSDVDDDGTLRLDASNLRRLEGLDESELDLAMRLELARKNSENQHVHRNPVPTVDTSVEETIYEGVSHNAKLTMLYY